MSPETSDATALIAAMSRAIEAIPAGAPQYILVNRQWARMLRRAKFGPSVPMRHGCSMRARKLAVMAYLLRWR